MVASISLTGLASNDPVPGEYAEIAFAQGEASLGTATYATLLIGGKLSTASATTDTVVYGPDTAVSMTSESDAISLFGAGSELHRMVRRFLAVNTTSPLYAIAVADGYGAVQATGTVTVTGTATSGGSIRVFVADEFVDVGFVTGDTPTDIAADLEIAVNSKTHWPCTADANAGVLTLTAKQPGERGNFTRYFAQVLPTTAGVSATPVASSAMTGGSVADSNATALATISPERYYYIVSAAQDSTQLSALLSQVNTQALPVTGIRQRVFGGSVDTLANTITVVNNLNGARAEMIWLYQSDVVPGELAANNAAVYALEEAPAVPRCNFDSYGDDARTASNWKIKAPLSGAKPTRSQIFAALNAGVTPIGVRKNSTYLVSRITTRYLNGATVDYRIRDAHKVTVCDRYVDDLIAKAAASLRGKTIANDPVRNEPTPGPSVVTPRVVKALIDRLSQDYAENDLLQNVTEVKANTQVIREAAPTTRMSARIPLQPIDVLHQVAFLVDQL
jgi:phage tail sheath gpL-like